MNDFEIVEAAACRLSATRVKAAAQEKALQIAVSKFLSLQPGSARDLAKRLGFTVQYICDIRHGRRTISDRFLARLRGL